MGGPDISGWDISGWLPRWAPARDQLAQVRTDLESLRGRRVVDSWLVWDVEHDDWFADLPVVIRFDDGRQLEICWQKFEDLSVTWNTIDVATVPVAWVTWPLVWRPQGHEALRTLHGQVVTSGCATEHLFSTRLVDPFRPGFAPVTSTWLVGGIWLQTEHGGLHVFNALDENGLTDEPPGIGEENRLLPL